MKQRLIKPTISIIFLILIGLVSNAFSACQIQYTGKAAQMFGSTPRGSFKNITECNNYNNSRPAFERNNSHCIGCSSGSQHNNSSGYTGGNQGAKNLIMNSFVDMFGNILSNTLNPVQQESNTQYQNNLLWKQEQSVIKKEEERKKSLAKWDKIKNNQKLQTLREEKEKKDEIEELLIQMKPIGSYDKVDVDSIGFEPLSIDSDVTLKPTNSNVELKLLSIEEYDVENLKTNSDPLLAPGSPIGSNLTEHGQIHQIIEESKYAHMEPSELIALKNSTNNTDIKKSIYALLSQKEAMSKLEHEVRKVNMIEDIKNINEKQAKREVERALGEVVALGIPAGDNLDEWLNKEQSTSTVAMNVGGEIITDKMKDFVVKMLPKLERAAVGLGHVEKAKHLFKFYVAVDKAGDHYVDAAEASAYIQASGSNGDILYKWSSMRNKALKESAKLYKLIQKEEKK